MRPRKMTEQQPASFQKLKAHHTYPLWRALLRADALEQELENHVGGTVAVPDQADCEPWLSYKNKQAQTKRLITTTIASGVLTDISYSIIEGSKTAY